LASDTSGGGEWSSFKRYSLGRSRTGLQSGRKYAIEGNLWVSPEDSTGIFIAFNPPYIIIHCRYFFNFLLNNYFRIQQHGVEHICSKK